MPHGGRSIRRTPPRDSASESTYFARFREQEGCRFRLDTRIYLEARQKPRAGDTCIGCIIGKNPGSAVPAARSNRSTPIALRGDRFLPNVRAILGAAYRKALTSPPEGAYLRVLNLFYLCDRDLRQAKAAFRGVERPLLCPREKDSYPWVWYAWGGPDRILDPLKARFAALASAEHFFFDNGSGKVVARVPAPADRARHTQGMPHGPVLEHISRLLSLST